MKLPLALVVSLLLFAAVPAGACTIVSGRAADGAVWTANNEDFAFDPDTYLNVLPRDAEGFGAIAFTYDFTYDQPEGYVQGGLNDQGLFFDFNALPAVAVLEPRHWDAKRDYPGGDSALIRHILRTCATVPDVVALLETYRLPALLSGQMHVADRQGNLAVLTADSFLVTTGGPLISTNFAFTKRGERGARACWRYPIARRMLAERGVSLESLRAVMDSTQQRRAVSTIFTNITNLSTGDIYFYYAGDFRRAWHFRIPELVARGRHAYRMRELFHDAPIVGIWERWQAEGAAAAVAYSRRMRDTLPEPVRAAALRHLAGDALLHSNRYADARVFVDEWLAAQGRRDPASDLHEGLARLAAGDFAGARDCLARQAAADSADPMGRLAFLPGERGLLARLDGRPAASANAHFELKGHRDAHLVCVSNISLWPLYTFLRPTADGWAGDFTLPPGKNWYAFTVDGRPLLDPENPVHEMVPTEDGPRELNVRVVE